MAKVKTFKARRLGNAGAHRFNRSNVPVCLPESGSYYFVGEEVLDKATLHPVQNKELAAFTARGGLGYEFPIQGWAAFETPTAVCSHDQANNYVGFSYRMYGPRGGQTLNLDPGYRMTESGTMIKFEDLSGKVHYIHTDSRDSAYWNDKHFITITQGDDLSAPEATYSTSLSIATTYLDWSTFYAREIKLIHVDPVRKVLYFLANAYFNSAYPHYVDTFLCTANFTTNPVDGSLAVSNFRALTGQPSSNTGAMVHYGNKRQYVYLGDTTTGDAAFMMYVENDSNTYSTSTTHYWFSPGVNWNKDTTRHRVVFFTYNHNTNSSSIVSDLNGSTGWGTGVADLSANGYVGTTHCSTFTQSPIVGEESVYYSYQLVVARTTNTPALARIRWNKSNNTFGFKICTITFPGTDTWANYFTHPNAPLGNTTHYLKTELVTKTAHLTVDTLGNWFVSLFNQNGWSQVESVVAGTNEQNCLVLQVNPADTSVLTFHSVVPAFSSLAATFPDSNGRRIISIKNGLLEIYDWTAAGWSSSLTASGSFYGVTQDSQGNIWGLELPTNVLTTTEGTPSPAGNSANDASFSCSLHLLSVDIPNVASITFEDPSLEYTGTNLTTNLVVNAYSSAGSRIASNVTLTLSGPNAVFTTNGLKSISISTSAAGDTLVGITISGAGYINASASFEL